MALATARTAHKAAKVTNDFIFENVLLNFRPSDALLWESRCYLGDTASLNVEKYLYEIGKICIADNKVFLCQSFWLSLCKCKFAFRRRNQELGQRSQNNNLTSAIALLRTWLTSLFIRSTASHSWAPLFHSIITRMTKWKWPSFLLVRFNYE